MPLFALVGAVLVMGATEGGFLTTTWYPVALLLLALLAALVTAVPPRAVPRLVVAALGLFAAYAAWSYLSITWADQPGPAWDGANRTLAYVIVFALASLWPVRGFPAVLALTALGLGIAAIGLVELLRVAAAEDPSGYFVYARLAEPVGYQNANAALWMIGFLPCVFAASRRELHPLVRGPALAGAALLLALAAMAQSRGWLFALPLVALLFVVLTPGRARLIVVLAAIGAATALYIGPVLSVHDDWEYGGPLNALIDDATGAMLPVLAVLLVLGTLAAALERRIRVAEPTARRAGRAIVAAAAAALVLGAAGAAIAIDDPVGKVSEAWEDFKGGEQAQEGGQSRFTGTLGSTRYEFWSVAWDRFESSPLKGIGAENFQLDYLRQGDSGEYPRYPHSLELGVLSQTGIVGALLLFGALGCALVTAMRGVLRAEGLAAAAAGAALTTFAYWFVHGSMDWFWEFPALAGAAFAMLGMAGALGPRPRPHPRTLLAHRRRVAAIALALVAAFAATVSFTAPWLAERDVERAGEIWRESPDDAFDRLDRAERLNPLAARPLLVSGSIAVRLDRLDIAERDFRSALEREPLNPYPILQLGLIAAQQGDKREAESRLRTAARLSPMDDEAERALEALRDGEDIAVADYNREILESARRRVDEQ